MVSADPRTPTPEPGFFMSEKEILRALARLKKETEGLRRDVHLLMEARLDGGSELRGMLRRRGLEPYRENPAGHLFFPPNFSEGEKVRFYELCQRYSFRLFLREILARRENFRLEEVVHFSSPETGRKYLRLLAAMGLAEPAAGRAYRLHPLAPVSLGPTLEWFMAELLKREFFCPALYGLRCKGTRYGGDFDVVSALEGRLLYIEVKSSPPRNIEGEEVHEFLSRLEDLIPHLALFFVDTELRMKDKIVPIFEAESSARRSPQDGAPAVERIGDEIFFLAPRVYILNSRGSISRNLAHCFKHHFAHPPARPLAGGSPLAVEG